MTSRSRPWRSSEQERRQRSMDATDAFLAWAKDGGIRPVTATCDLRDWVLVLGVIALHAAELTTEGGDPSLLVAIAARLANDVREVTGEEELCRLLEMAAVMMTGVA